MFCKSHENVILLPLEFYSFNLHCDIIGGCWGALQHFIGAAAGAALKYYTGWDEDVLHLIWILLQDIHQYLSGLTHTLVVHHHQWDHVMWTSLCFLRYVGTLDS